VIVDSRSFHEGETVETDVCIVGAGTAGISLAREFIGEQFRVCLLESGGLEPDKATQSLYWGENIGHPYYELDTARARFFGGTGNYWHIPLGEGRLGVRLRPLDSIDFERREWVPHSGWPFDRSHLDPFYERAQSICQIGPFAYNVEDWEDSARTPRLPLNGDQVKTAIFQFGKRDHFLREYKNEINGAGNITTCLHGNAVDIETEETAKRVTRLKVADLEGKAFWVSARLFILAMGAIETPRLLLLSNKVQETGLGNLNDLVGRFFMEHPHLWSGYYVPSDQSIFGSVGLYKVHDVNNVPIMGKLTLNEEVIRSERLLNYCVSIHPKFIPSRRLRHTPSKGVESLRELRSAVRHRKVPRNADKLLGNVITDIGGIASHAYKRTMKKSDMVPVFTLNHMTEQAPDPDSRITLGEERDALGQNRVQLNWRLSPLDIQSIIRAQEIIDSSLRRAGLGYLHIELEGETPPPGLHGGWHHMGTTRMHVDPQKGVVDKDCKVHGISNLYIAGASVFPTGGYANPVLTTVALAVRLADHVKSVMA
jgi:choline dehydrogenase-like flavoprotein